MPASEVMNLYRQHKLHSGPGGPVVKKKKQAVAIQISMARKEGHHIPVKGSFQQGGQVPETGNYKVHQGEQVKVGTFDQKQKGEPDRRSLIDPKTGEWPGTISQSADFPQQRQQLVPEYVSDVRHLESPAHYTLQGDVWHPELKHRSAPGVKGSFQHGGLVPETGNYQVHQGEEVARRAQAQDIAARTNQAQHDEWNRAMRQKEDYGAAMAHGRPSEAFGAPPLPRDVPPAGTDVHYAIEGLRGNVAQRMREQGERAAGIRGSFQEGGTAQQTGDYKVHQGEELVPPEVAGMGRPGGTAPGEAAPGMTPREGGTSVTPIEKPNMPGDTAGKGYRPNKRLESMQAAVGSPLQRSSSNFDAPPESYKRGGTIPRTGIYRLHAGETVIPKSLAQQYRKARNG